MSKVKTAGVFLINKDKKILICHPTNAKSNIWSIPKGKVDANESILEAAIRETIEETNFDLANHKVMIEMEPIEYKHKKKVLYPFIAHEHANNHLDWSGQNIKCNSKVPADRGNFYECDEFRWCSLSEAKTLLHETQVKALNDVELFINSAEYLKKDW